MDFFRDYFTRETLVDSILKSPYVPGQFAELFETRPLSSTTMAVELADLATSTVLTSGPRGRPLPLGRLGDRRVETFNATTIGLQDAIYADEVLNSRALGMSLAGEVIAARRDEKVASMRADIDHTLEHMRLSVVLNPDSAIGSAPADVTVAFQTDATKTRGEIFTKIVEPMEAALKGARMSKIRLYCSSDVWAAVIENKAMRESMLYLQNVQGLTGNTLDSFTHSGIEFVRYRGAGSTVITAGKAVAVPVGVPGMFLQGFAPDDTLDSVGSGALGAPYYPSARISEDGKKWILSIQSHPVMVCTRPEAVLTVKLS